MPRTRATEPSRGQHLRRCVQARPFRGSQPRAPTTTRDCNQGMEVYIQGYLVMYAQCSPLICGAVDIPGRRMFKRRNSGVPILISTRYDLCEARWCCTAAAAAAVRLLCRGYAFLLKRKCVLEFSLVVLRMAPPHTQRTHARNHRPWLSQKKDLQVTQLWCHGYHNVKRVLRCHTGTER